MKNSIHRGCSTKFVAIWSETIDGGGPAAAKRPRSDAKRREASKSRGARQTRGNYVKRDRGGGIPEAWCRFPAILAPLTLETPKQLVSNDGAKRQGPLECTYIPNLTYAHLLERPIVAVSSLRLSRLPARRCRARLRVPGK